MTERLLILQLSASPAVTAYSTTLPFSTGKLPG
jgi:hypothetical protein